MRKKIVYISTSSFPYGQAYSTRLMNFARLFYLLDYDVHIISDFTYKEFVDSKKINKFENCTYQIVSGEPTSLNRVKSTFFSTKVIHDYITNNAVDYVIIGNSYDRFNRVKKICKKHRIPLILEICEWYDTSTRKFGNLNPYNVVYNRCMKNDYTKADGYITISRYLYDYFRSYSENVIKIPTILDPDNTPFSTEIKNEKINLVHLGLSGVHKEKFKNILLALELLGDDKKKFEYNIYGSDEKTVLMNIDNDAELLNRLTDIVSIHGKVNQNEVNNIYMNADYSIFMRPCKRSSDAGFPTKLAESMVAGTPVITNNTGDISLYLNNSEEGFLLDSDSPEIIANLLKQIINMTRADKRKMRIAARDRAEKSFAYKSYSENFDELISSMNSRIVK